jgi:hypothetical protein
MSRPRKDGAEAVVIIGKRCALLAIAGLFLGSAFAAEIVPDSDLTSGAVRIDGHDIAKTCGHAREHREWIPNSLRDEVLSDYGLPTGTHPTYEIDHLIPLCLGGSNDIANLWPQPRRQIESTWNAEAKDRLERRLCDMVCAGQVDIGTAQQDIATDWIKAYRKYIGGSVR